MSSVDESEIIDHLRDAMERSVVNGNFEIPEFFQTWFFELGTPLFFLFKKNLKVTNMQVAELHALLRTHVTRKTTKDSPTAARLRDFQLLSVYDFQDAVRNTVGSFPGEDKPQSIVARLYHGLLRDIVCIEVYFGSCAVFLPAGLTCDLQELCANSGYIHSCGTTLLTRNIAKASKEELFNVLRKYTKKNKATFIVYAHEEFTRDVQDVQDKYDHALREQEAKNGLADTRLYLDKYYMGTESLVSILREVKTTFPSLYIPEPGKSGTSDLASRKTVWLMVDHKPQEDIRNRGDAQYYLLYEQSMSNKTPLHIFDENKPAWIDHTTIPDTLMAAMINVTRPWWPPTGVTLGDPFVGTGTSWLEGIKYGLRGICVDEELIVHQVVKDNLSFLNLHDSGLKALENCIKEAINANIAGLLNSYLPNAPSPSKLDHSGDDRFGVSQHMPDIVNAFQLYTKACRDLTRNVDFGNDFKSAFEAATISFNARMVFYIHLRNQRRNSVAFQRHAFGAWWAGFVNEANQLRAQIRAYRELQSRLANGGVEHGAVTGQRIAVFAGKYSKSCCIDPSVYAKAQRSFAKTIACGDARELRARSCDIIITDPPYGFNADVSREALARLYHEVIPVMIRALKESGQIVIALPDWSNIGKQVPFFITKHFVIQQILAAAAKQGKEVVRPVHTVPSPGSAFRAPFYWESERALRRAILHFIIKDVPALRKGIRKE